MRFFIQRVQLVYISTVFFLNLKPESQCKSELTGVHYNPISKLIFTVCNKVAKVMFIHLSVRHSVHRGRVLGQVAPPGMYTPQAGTPQAPPAAKPPGEVHPPGRYTPQAGTPPRQVHTPWQVHPQAGTPPKQAPPKAGTPPSRYTPQAGTPGQVHPQQVHPMGRYTPQGRYTPWQMATVADSMHPTGMHSCFKGHTMGESPFLRKIHQCLNSCVDPGRALGFWPQPHPQVLVNAFYGSV